MSQRIVTTDDHTGDEIVSDIESSQARVGLIRDGKGYSWRGIHLSDASWNELVKIIDEYLPGITATEIDANGDPRADADEPSEADEQSAAEDEARAVQTAALADRAADARQARELADAEPETPGMRSAEYTAQKVAEAAASRQAVNVISANGAPMTQAERKALSKAIRAWWYGLDAKTLKALNLKTPNRSVTLGKLPPAVVTAYHAVNA